MIALEKLVMLALDELGEVEAAEVEEHVLGCGECAALLEHLLNIGGAVGEVVAEGKVGFSASGDAIVEKLKAAGLISRTYHLAPDHLLPCAVGAKDVYAMTTLEADLRGVAHLDLVQTTSLGSMRMQDVPFDAKRGLVRFVVRSDQLRMLPSTRVRLELFATDMNGGLIHRWQLAPNGTWSGWQWMGVFVQGPPAVARSIDTRLELFAADPNGGLIHAWQLAANGGWSGWQWTGVFLG